ncbi:pyruvate dehydrogenase E1 component beta subunit, partial [Enteropsectra breve]
MKNHLVLPLFAMTTVRAAINEAFEEEMKRDNTVFIIGEEVGASGGPNGTTQNILGLFGSMRAVDTPISEIGFTGLAVGASFCGLRPVVDFMTWNFALQAIDHIINSCAKTSYMSGGALKCPIVFRGPAGFNPGYAAQHTQE